MKEQCKILSRLTIWTKPIRISVRIMKKLEKNTMNNYAKTTRNVKSSALKFSTLDLYKEVSQKKINKTKIRKTERRIEIRHGGYFLYFL
jgi:hypothetical protein